MARKKGTSIYKDYNYKEIYKDYNYKEIYPRKTTPQQKFVARKRKEEKPIY